MGGSCSKHREGGREEGGGDRNAYNILVGKPEGKRPLGRPPRRRKDKIRMDLKEIR
jgi:hypothetical protein